MFALILGVSVPAVYMTGWTLLARTLYRRYRIHEAQKRSCPKRARQGGWHDYHCKRCRNDVLWWESKGTHISARTYDDGALTGLAIIHAFPWPLVLPLLIMLRVITANPTLSPSEIKTREQAYADRIAELEELNRKLSEFPK